MAKQQTFASKAKGKQKDTTVTVKVVRSVKSEKGSYQFIENFVKLDDINKVTNLK